MKTQEFYSHGKLLLTGEYVVLDGAESLVLPVKFGQSLTVTPVEGHQFQWTSYLRTGSIWQDFKFELSDILKPSSSNQFKNQLFKILNTIFQTNPNLFNQTYAFSTRLEFNKDWGLGSSSTLINNIAEWAQVDAYDLLAQTFGGSGYDIAAAKMQNPFTYKKIASQIFTTKVDINNDLKDYLYFIYLNQKQNSREAIKNYKRISLNKQQSINKISSITHQIINATHIAEFEKLLTKHEQILSIIIKQKTVKDVRFKDYKGGIVKSLGAWGGDFVLVTAKSLKDLDYFKARGYSIILSYKELIL